MCPNRRSSRPFVRSHVPCQIFGNVHRLREAFDVLDRDGDGVIAASDLEGFLLKVVACRVISKVDVARMLALVEGDVDFDQFLRLLKVDTEAAAAAASAVPDGEDAEYLKKKDDEALQAMFRSLDRNGDGVVCMEDLQAVVNSANGLSRRASWTDVRTLLEEFQAIGEEKRVTYQEFEKIMKVEKPQRNGVVRTRMN